MSFNPNIVTSYAARRQNNSVNLNFLNQPVLSTLALGINSGPPLNDVGNTTSFSIQNLRDNFGFNYPVPSIDTVVYSGASALLSSLNVGIGLMRVSTSTIIYRWYLTSERQPANSTYNGNYKFGPYHCHLPASMRGLIDLLPNDYQFYQVFYTTAAGANPVTNFNSAVTFSFVEDYTDDYITGLGATTREYRR